MTQESRAAFDAWHKERADAIRSRAIVYVAEAIADGFSDSGPTHRTALYKALDEADETGWDTWQASRKQALEDAIRVAGPEDSYQDSHFSAKADAVNKIKELL